MSLIYKMPGFSAEGATLVTDTLGLTTQEKAISSLPFLASWLDVSRRGDVGDPEAIDAVNGDQWFVRTITVPTIAAAYVNLNGVDAINFTAGGNQALRMRSMIMPESYTLMYGLYVSSLPAVVSRILMTYAVNAGGDSGMVVRFESRKLTFNPGVDDGATAFSHSTTIADGSKHIVAVSFDADTLEGVLYVDTVASGEDETFSANSAPVAEFSNPRLGGNTGSDVPQVYVSDVLMFRAALHDRHVGVLSKAFELLGEKIDL